MKNKLEDLWRKFKSWKLAMEVKFILWKVDRNIKNYHKKQKKLQKK
tara:strand:- start:94 stop:231 length:138 start_codon:yes stop_codon:yes gene_type:complete